MRWMLVLSLVTLSLLALPSIQQEASEDDNNAAEEEEENEEGEDYEEEEEEENHRSRSSYHRSRASSRCHYTDDPPRMRKMNPDGDEAQEALKSVLRILGKDQYKLQFIFSMFSGRAEHCKYQEDMTWYRAKYKYKGRTCWYKWTRCRYCKTRAKGRGGPICD